MTVDDDIDVEELVFLQACQALTGYTKGRRQPWVSRTRVAKSAIIPPLAACAKIPFSVATRSMGEGSVSVMRSTASSGLSGPSQRAGDVIPSSGRQDRLGSPDFSGACGSAAHRPASPPATAKIPSGSNDFKARSKRMSRSAPVVVSRLTMSTGWRRIVATALRARCGGIPRVGVDDDRDLALRGQLRRRSDARRRRETAAPAPATPAIQPIAFGPRPRAESSRRRSSAMPLIAKSGTRHGRGDAAESVCNTSATPGSCPDPGCREPSPRPGGRPHSVVTARQRRLSRQARDRDSRDDGLRKRVPPRRLPAGPTSSRIGKAAELPQPRRSGFGGHPGVTARGRAEKETITESQAQPLVTDRGRRPAQWWEQAALIPRRQPS